MKSSGNWSNAKEVPEVNVENIQAEGNVTIASVKKKYRNSSLELLSIVAMLTLATFVVVVSLVAIAVPPLQDRTPGDVRTEPDNGEKRGTAVAGAPELEGIRAKPTPGNGLAYTASIDVLGATLLADGQLEVRGEVHPLGWGNPAAIQEYLRTLEVRVTLGDGLEAVSAVTAQSKMWRAVLRPTRPPNQGERLDVTVVLLADRGKHVLDRITEVVPVDNPGSSL